MIDLTQVTPGKVLLLHSSLSRTLRENKCTPEDVLHSFLERLGPDGTLILPLFNFDFTKGVPFDIKTTRSQMGALTEAGRNFQGSVRTGHPIYSFSVIGSRSKEFENIDNCSAYGKDSPFAILRSLNADIGVIDLPDQNSITFYHHVEEMERVPYRFHKTFTGSYTDFSGETKEKSYQVFVRDLNAGVVTRVNPMGELLWERGLYRGSRPGSGNGLRLISANALYKEVVSVIRLGLARKYLYDIDR